MKKLMSVLIVLTMIIGMTVNTFAATPTKYADCTTDSQRIQYFKDTYGFTEITGVSSGVVKEVLDTAQQGFTLVGTATTKKLLAPFAKQLPLDIFSRTEWPYDVGHFGASYNSTGITGGSLRLTDAITARGVVHEMMHAFDFGILGDSGASAIATTNGKYSGYTSADQYVTSYAANNAKEDFAETCATMIVNGGDTPCTLSKDTILYKKYKACYDLMAEHLGTKSNATIRSAAFLGIELSAE